MCGIVGVGNPSSSDAENWVARNVKALEHRGPDDDGV